MRESSGHGTGDSTATIVNMGLASWRVLNLCDTGSSRITAASMEWQGTVCDHCGVMVVTSLFGFPQLDGIPGYASWTLIFTLLTLIVAHLHSGAVPFRQMRSRLNMNLQLRF